MTESERNLLVLVAQMLADVWTRTYETQGHMPRELRDDLDTLRAHLVDMEEEQEGAAYRIA